MKNLNELKKMNADAIRIYALSEFGIEETDFDIDWSVEHVNTATNKTIAIDRVVELMEMLGFPIESGIIAEMTKEINELRAFVSPCIIAGLEKIRDIKRTEMLSELARKREFFEAAVKGSSFESGKIRVESNLHNAYLVPTVSNNRVGDWHPTREIGWTGCPSVSGPDAAQLYVIRSSFSSRIRAFPR